MKLNRISIKMATTTNLIFMGISLTLLSIYLSTSYQVASIENEKRIISRGIEVGAQQIIEKLVSQSVQMSMAVTQDRNFKENIKNYQQPRNKEALVRLFDDQFSQRWVTAEILELVKIRLYDANLNYIIESTLSKKELPKKIPAVVYTQATNQKKNINLETLSGLWTENESALLSTLIPFKNSGLDGYIEIVTNPSFSLIKIEQFLGSPIIISNLKYKPTYKSKSWGDAFEESLVVDYELKSKDNFRILGIHIIDDIKILNEKFAKTQLTSLTIFIVILVSVIFFSIFVFSKFAFTPLKELVKNMKKSAEGDLTIKIKTNGLQELKIIGESLESLIGNLRSQMNEVENTATDLSISSVTLNENTHSMNEAIQKQLIETDQVASAINEMSATVQEVSSHAEQASNAANSADKEAKIGQQVVDKTISQINSLATNIDNTASVIEELKRESENIGAVMSVIEEIAEQTNLLALNAAIEAARAGELGRGFAVVADEVRTLANRTQDATQNIKDIIEKVQLGANQAMTAMHESKNNTQTTVEQAATAGESLKLITQSVNNIMDMNHQISTAATEQTAVAGEINQNITSINAVSQTTAKGADKISRSGNEMAELSQNLQNLVKKFQL